MNKTITTVAERSDTIAPMTEAEVLDALRITELETMVNYTLADAMRDGSTVTAGTVGWGSGGTACALSAARLSATARGYLP